MVVIDFVLKCLDYSSDTIRSNEVSQISSEEWSRLRDCARLHSVSPILYSRFQDLGNAIPEKVLLPFKEDFLKLAYLNINLYHGLQSILECFHQKNLAVIVLKGAYLAEAVYSNIALRSMSDIDLLVRKDDLKLADKMLISLGYLPKEEKQLITMVHHHFVYVKENSPAVEVHWVLNELFSSKDATDGIWDRAVPVQIANRSAYTLCPVDVVLYLCLHISMHAESLFLQMLVDIGEMVKHFQEQLDWEGIISRAKAWGIHRAVYVVLALSKELLHIPIPDYAIRSLYPEDFQESYYKFIKEKFLNRIQIDEITLETMKRTTQKSSWTLKRLLQLIQKGFVVARDSIAVMYSIPIQSKKIWWYFPVYLRKNLFRNIRKFIKINTSNQCADLSLEKKYQAIAVKNWLHAGIQSTVIHPEKSKQSASARYKCRP